MYNELRSAFVAFFTNNKHLELPSSSLVPHGDNSILFVNSGMVQFKNVFCGLDKISANAVVTAQKCMRAGGKHNDLDQVGYSRRHHTFFEMLGNFSFGLYFKEEAIKYAWDFIMNLGINKDRLYITIYAGDNEALAIWRSLTGFSNERIISISTDDNFWSMGSSGPCGPCSEIYYSYHAAPPKDSKGNIDFESPHIVEIWNLVFMQYEDNNGIRTPLEQKCIDTGMGLERIVAVMEGVNDNYETSLFKTIIEYIVSTYESQNNKELKIAARITSDHIRASSFLIADGILPSNEGRGYVLRRIMRRAMKYLYEIDTKESKMHLLVDVIDSSMGDAYPEIRKHKAKIMKTIAHEESAFREQLERGMVILNDAITNMGSDHILSGEIAFKLYDTYGFPIDITIDQLKKYGKTFDQKGFDAQMAIQRNRNVNVEKIHHDHKIWFSLKSNHGKTDFFGYDALEHESNILELLDSNLSPVDNITTLQDNSQDYGWMIANSTTCYATGGGQSGDNGTLNTETGCAAIIDTQKFADGVIAHKIIVTEGHIQTNQVVNIKVDQKTRLDKSRHHSTTHLLNHALRTICGMEVSQMGSFIDAQGLRFDFNYQDQLSKGLLMQIEDFVNQNILLNSNVQTDVVKKDAASSMNAIMAFDEKYGDIVRVVRMSDSVECCGGTHVQKTGDIGIFKITNGYSIGSGIKRIEGLSGTRAMRYIQTQDAMLYRLQQYCGDKNIVNVLKKISDATSDNDIKTGAQYKQILQSLAQDNPIERVIIKAQNNTKNANKLATEFGLQLLEHQLINNLINHKHSKMQIRYCNMDNIEQGIARKKLCSIATESSQELYIIILKQNEKYIYIISGNITQHMDYIKSFATKIENNLGIKVHNNIATFSSSIYLDAHALEHLEIVR